MAAPVDLFSPGTARRKDYLEFVVLVTSPIPDQEQIMVQGVDAIAVR
jgi:hypothetical protein